MRCIEFRRIKVLRDWAIDEEAFELILDHGKVQEVKRWTLSLVGHWSQSAAVVLSNPYIADELVHRGKSWGSSDNVMPEYLRILVTIDV